MTLNLSMPGQEDLKPRITVFGVGGAGGNAVNNMIEKALDGVDFVVANTDAQALQQSKSDHKIQLGVKVTEGLGAGARPSVGAAAAEESIEQIVDHLAGAHMCFITAGMGGGTGTGAAPIIAQAARELGVLTVGVVTKPFQFEGAKRMRHADEGIEALQKVVDTLIIIPNQNLFLIANEHTTFTDAFAMADEVLHQGVKGVTDLMVRPGLINLDFADVRAVMDEMGKAMMGTGEAEGDNRAITAAENAIANPLLDEVSLVGAKGVLINITGGYDLTLFELDEAANQIREKVDPDANIIVGSTLDTEMDGRMRVSVVATGIDAEQVANQPPVQRRKMSEPLTQQVQSEERPAAAADMAPELVAEAAPQPAPQPAPEAAPQPAPMPQVAEAQPTPHATEPSLFDEPAQQAAATDDDLPPPAYVPRPEPRVETPASDFVAPRAPGTPSPEALQRLQAAVAHRGQGGTAAAQPRPAPAAAPQPAQRRGGLGGLIGRMAGAHAEAQQPPAAASQGGQDHPVQAHEAEAPGEEERIEIPAFLRRQAN